MNAVRADDGIGNSGFAVGESKPDAIAGLVQSNQFVAQPDMFVGHGAGERSMQIAAMRQ